MKDIQALETLFFDASKNYFKPIKKYLVEGYPDFNGDKKSYDTYEKDFFFRTYKEIIVAGIFWTKKLFALPSVKDIYVEHIEYGRKKQWFNVQLVKTGTGVIIDGENYNPFINIAYSYNSVTKVKFDLGFYRAACSNGMLSGFNELSKMEIKPENLFEVPFWLNPCLIQFLTKRFELQIKILKNTSIKGEEIENWIQKNIAKWNISKELIETYIDEVGNNAYALLNILTDSASNYRMAAEAESLLPINYINDNNEKHNYSERATRQKKIGKFVEYLVEQIMQENKIEKQTIDINSPNFTLNDENIGLLDNLPVKEKYKLDIGKIKF